MYKQNNYIVAKGFTSMVEELSINQREILELLNKGLKAPEIAKERNVTRQAVSKVIKKLMLKGYVKTEKKILPTKEYKAVKYKGRNVQLHRVIYSKHFGKIPKGNIIHYIDFNKHNNNIANLICLTPNEHNELHKRLRLELPILTERIIEEIRNN